MYQILGWAFKNGLLRKAEETLEACGFTKGICSVVAFVTKSDSRSTQEIGRISHKWPKASDRRWYPVHVAWFPANPQIQFDLCRALHKEKQKTEEQEKFLQEYTALRRELWQFILEEVKESCTDTTQ